MRRVSNDLFSGTTAEVHGEAERLDSGLTVALEKAARSERPSGEACLAIARQYLGGGDEENAARWVLRIADDLHHFRPWQAGGRMLARLDYALPTPLRKARVAVLGTYTTSQYVPMLALAARRFGVAIEAFEGGYAQYEQQLLDPASALYAFEPDFVVIAAHEGATRLAGFDADPQVAVEAEVDRWTSLWHLARKRAGCRMLQHLFARRPEAPYGHLEARLPGTRNAMIQAVNIRLGQEAGDEVLLVDCDRLAALFGSRRWFDDRYWHLAKQAVALDALPLLAHHTAAVLAGDLGLSRKCIVLDLDNTLWGGVIGEDGVEGIDLGTTAEGEAFVAFQRFLLEQKEKGILLAVCSKNNPADARQPFERHPEMVLRVEDFAAFEASWDHKPDVLRRIAEQLGIGLDSIVYIDDNPAERNAVRLEVGEVDVLAMPSDPSGYVAALAEYPLLETVRLTEDDRERTRRYRARAEAKAILSTVSDLPSYWRSLEMRTRIAPIDDFQLARAAQLINKTNQFNLTTRRRSADELRAIVNSPDWLCLYGTLTDRFSDHGVVSVVLAYQEGNALHIDTLLMSCRVIGRTLERSILECLSEHAQRRGCITLNGSFVPTEKNQLAEPFYPQNGFSRTPQDSDNGTTCWSYELRTSGSILNEYIEMEPT